MALAGLQARPIVPSQLTSKKTTQPKLPPNVGGRCRKAKAALALTMEELQQVHVELKKAFQENTNLRTDILSVTAKIAEEHKAWEERLAVMVRSAEKETRSKLLAVAALNDGLERRLCATEERLEALTAELLSASSSEVILDNGQGYHTTGRGKELMGSCSQSPNFEDRR
eukprot:TRINITY_DN37093_c0_g1_i1.p1 TRINITY_DN37093_c0_g1~~TRINITY_DN37093_c0_g1_i1.p1  ORF type:complete len:170 (+),score=0.06 TRINITY_DN37093_c0_g1_i1:326-835(+)